jgi:hypothetical protein
MTDFDRWLETWGGPITRDDIAVLGTAMYRSYLELCPPNDEAMDADAFYDALMGRVED